MSEEIESLNVQVERVARRYHEFAGHLGEIAYDLLQERNRALLSCVADRHGLDIRILGKLV